MLSASPIRVVVVDDHEQFAGALALLLGRDARLDVVGVATSAHDGIELALEHEADVVLMDVAMPGLDGLEATRRLRSLRPRTGVILLSGADEAELRDGANEAGAAALLTKGFVHEHVTDEILRVAGAA